MRTGFGRNRSGNKTKKDGEVTAADAAAILRFVVGLIDVLPLA